MRIAYLHQYFVKPDMSGGTRSFDLAHKLAEAGHDVHIITTWRAGGERARRNWSVEPLSGFHVHWLPVPYSNSMGVYRRLAAFAKFALMAGRRIAEVGADLVFATSTPLTVAVPAVRASRKLGVPMVFEVRDLWPDVPIAMGVLRNPVAKSVARRLELYAYQNACHIVALSPGMADGVASRGIPRNRISVIPNMANNALFGDPRPSADEFFAAYPQFRGRPLVLYSGAIGEANGVDYLVRMAAKLKDLADGPRFLVAGEGKLAGAVKDLANALGVFGQNFFMIEPVVKKMMPALLAAATVATSLFVNISALANSSPNKFFDALASGKPVMINWNGWLADLIVAAGAGIFVPPDNPELAAEQLQHFLADHVRVKHAGDVAKQLAVERFDKDVLSARLVAVLEAAASA